MTTRAEFLARIRGEMRKTSGLFPACTAERPARPTEEAALLRRQLAARWAETLERFRVEFERVGGVFYRAASASVVAGIVREIARGRAATRVVAWPASAVGVDLAPGLIGEGLEVYVVPAGDVPATERERVRAAVAAADIGLTGVDLAIAETGTLLLRSGAGRPRSVSLLPPCHVAVFDARALSESLAELGLVLEAWHAESDVAMINLITGPSRTADIELTLTRGVHGPGEVHVIFVEWRLDE